MKIRKSAVVVGLLHNSSKISPHQGRMNFWLTVLTGNSGTKVVFGVFGFHSVHAVMCLPLR